jgi:hypothetical protein
VLLGGIRHSFPEKPLRLLDRFRLHLGKSGLACRDGETYLYWWVRRYIYFHGKIHPVILRERLWRPFGVTCGERAANVMTLIQSARINDPDPQAYRRNVLERMPTARRSDLNDLLAYNWKAAVKV